MIRFNLPTSLTLAPLSVPIVLSTNVNENRLGKRRIISATRK